MCPRCMCQSLVISSFSVAAEASPIIMLLVNLYNFDVRSPLRIVMEPLVTLIPPSAPENLYPRASKAPNERRFFFKSETCRTFVGFKPIHQTSSYKCCRCQQSYTQYRFPSGQSLHHKACKYWTTLFLGTCGMCTPSQVTKHLSIYLSLTQPSRYHMNTHLLLRQPGLIWLSTGTRLIRIFATFSLQHLLVFHTIFLDVPWFLAKVARETARSLWIPFGSLTLWSSPLALDKNPEASSVESVFFISSLF